MKILQWAFPYLPTRGGREIFIERLSSDLHSKGNDIFMFANESREDAPLIESVGNQFPIERINLELVSKLEKPELFEESIAHAVSCLDKWKPEIVHLHNIAGMSPMLLSESLKRLNFRPKIVLTHHSLADKDSFIKVGRWKLLAQIIDVVVLPSQYNYDMFKAFGGFPTSKAKLIHNGVPLPNPSDASIKLGSEEYFVYGGRLAFEKGVGVLLSAWKMLQTKNPNIKLKIAGAGALDAMLRDFAREIQVDDSVEFLGWVDQAEMRDLISGSIGVVVPSTYSEPFGLIAAEAQALGIPVIASNIGGLSEIVDPGKTGLLIQPGDFSQLYGAMRYFIENTEVRIRFGEEGAKRTAKLFSLEDSHRKYESLFLDLINEHP